MFTLIVSLRVVASSVSLDMVEVASSNLAGPTKYKRARLKRAFLCLEVYHTIGLAKPVEKRDLRRV